MNKNHVFAVATTIALTTTMGLSAHANEIDLSQTGEGATWVESTENTSFPEINATDVFNKESEEWVDENVVEAPAPSLSDVPVKVGEGETWVKENAGEPLENATVNDIEWKTVEGEEWVESIAPKPVKDLTAEEVFGQDKAVSDASSSSVTENDATDDATDTEDGKNESKDEAGDKDVTPANKNVEPGKQDASVKSTEKSDSAPVRSARLANTGASILWIVAGAGALTLVGFGTMFYGRCKSGAEET